MRKNRLSRQVVVGVVVVLATIVAGGPVSAEPSPDPTGSAPALSDVDRARESIDYLMTTYHVSQDEALRRLRVQARAAGIVERVRPALGDELLSFYMDQEHDGKLTFLTSQPDVAAKEVGKVPKDLIDTKFVQSKHTAKQLDAARSTVEKRLSGKANVSVWTDKANERVAVTYTGTDAAVASQVRNLAGPVADDDVAVTVDTSGPPTGVQKSCSLLSCDPPGRGGVRMHIHRDDGSWGSCTAGFNVRGSNGWGFILTAGHCVTVPGPKRQYAYHNGLPLVWEKPADGYDEHDPNAPTDSRYFINQPFGLFHDWALMPYQTDGTNWVGYWLNTRGAHNLVASSCVSPSPQNCAGNTNYAMQGVYSWANIGMDWIVCATGTGTGVVYPNTNVGYRYGTHCGQVKSTMMTNYSGAGVDGHGIEVNICSRDGDSGGPLFSQLDSMAFGILSGGPPGTGACGSSEYSVYSSVEQDLLNAQSATGISFHVITTATG